LTRSVLLAALAGLAVLLAGTAGGAAFELELVALDPLPTTPESKPSDRRPDMLPDGVVTRGNGTIRAAWLIGPTERYGHGVLGDAIEASGLAVETAAGEVLSLTLGPDAVFEDRLPRLVDLDSDGRDEVLLVKSRLTEGAALALVAVLDGRLSIVAESAAIGRPNRWLNPAGAADFDGDGRIETAHVETPHIGGTLVLSRLEGARLTPLHRAAGFSNHRLGARELGLSAVLDADRDGIPDLLLPDDSRTRLRLVTFAGGSFQELARVDLGAEITSPPRPIDLNDDDRTALAIRLSDSRRVALVFDP
jgi:hypothetical protein